jgi:hypothetical protein
MWRRRKKRVFPSSSSQFLEWKWQKKVFFLRITDFVGQVRLSHTLFFFVSNIRCKKGQAIDHRYCLTARDLLIIYYTFARDHFDSFRFCLDPRKIISPSPPMSKGIFSHKIYSNCVANRIVTKDNCSTEGKIDVYITKGLVYHAQNQKVGS